eukprot:6768861-Alexandrium_andersonii.AAC.1
MRLYIRRRLSRPPRASSLTAPGFAEACGNSPRAGLDFFGELGPRCMGGSLRPFASGGPKTET